MRVNFVDLFWNQVLIELIIGALVPFFFFFFLILLCGVGVLSSLCGSNEWIVVAFFGIMRLLELTNGGFRLLQCMGFC